MQHYTLKHDKLRSSAWAIPRKVLSRCGSGAETHVDVPAQFCTSAQHVNADYLLRSENVTRVVELITAACARQ